jgi:RimJ/RimL family protein N-acetyltransferase
MRATATPAGWHAGAMEPLELTDGVVVLRAPGPQDVDRITEICQEPSIQRWTTVPSPYARADAEGFVTGMVRDGWADGSSLTWAVRVDDVLVGMVGLAMEGVGSAEIGYWLASDHRGRGLMSRAVALVLDVAFGRLALDRVLWRAYAGNLPSRHVAERAGFRVEGEIRLGAIQRGVRCDEWLGTLLRDDPR